MAVPLKVPRVANGPLAVKTSYFRIRSDILQPGPGGSAGGLAETLVTPGDGVLIATIYSEV